MASRGKKKIEIKQKKEVEQKRYDKWVSDFGVTIAKMLDDARNNMIYNEYTNSNNTSELNIVNWKHWREKIINL